MFDILGFKDWIEGGDLKDVVDRAHLFMKHARGIKTAFGKTSGLHADRLTIRLFQDTAVIVSSGNDEADFKATVYYSAALIGFAFMTQILLRGAITIGEVYADDDMVIGRGLVRAYEMEQLQDWIGCWVDDKCMNDNTRHNERGVGA